MSRKRAREETMLNSTSSSNIQNGEDASCSVSIIVHLKFNLFLILYYLYFNVLFSLLNNII